MNSLSRFLAGALSVLGAACEASTGSPPQQTRLPAAISIVAGDGQSATASTAVKTTPVVVVVDNSGKPVDGAEVTFSVSSGSGWLVATRAVTDASGRASATWYLGAGAGQQQLDARVGSLNVRFTATSKRPAVGAGILGDRSFIEWIPGELPIVISAPHGGTTAPSEIPDRTLGTTSRDLNTDDLARQISDAFATRFGKRPHVVICRLSRSKLDANREILEGAANNAIAERAWREYHGFLEGAAAEVRLAPGIGLYVDLHGHGHDIQRLELGYLLVAGNLSKSDVQLDGDPVRQETSLWALAALSADPFSALLRGPRSLGARFEGLGYPSVPSPANPSPGSNPYFEGGYSTERHARSTDNRFAGFQLEANLTGVRDTPANRQAFAAAFVTVVGEFLRDQGRALERRHH